MFLYENFNTTNQTSPHAEKHINFVTDMQMPTCAVVATLEYQERCKYILATDQCRENIFIIDYTDLLYCKIDARTGFASAMGVLLLLVILLALFVMLGITANGFFCPSLAVVSRMLGLNENVAGVTLLAFGNGAPDILTSYASLSTESKSQFSNTYGVTIFVVMLVAGIVVTYKPFSVLPESFLRDILFLLLSICFIDYCIKLNYYITFAQAITLLCIYICYIFVVILDQHLLKRATRSLERTKKRLELLEQHESEADAASLFSLKKEGVLPIYSSMSMNSKTEDHHTELKLSEYGLFAQFLYTVIPFTMEQFRSSNRLARIWLCFRFPVLLCLRFFIPMIDVDETVEGWSKLLNCMQICTLPTLIAYGLTNELHIYGIPVYVIVALVTAVLAAILFFITVRNEPPKFLIYYSILSVLGSIYVVYSVAQEIASVLDVLGIVTQRSNSFIGCTLLAMGNSVGDLISNLSLARTGYQRMAFAACFGGPLFNSLLSLSPPLIYRCYFSDTGYVTFPEGTMGENATIFLYFGLIGTTIAAATTNFAFRRSVGIFMLTVYSLYLFFTILGEMEVIHTFGSDHSLDLRIDVSL